MDFDSDLTEEQARDRAAKQQRTDKPTTTTHALLATAKPPLFDTQSTISDQQLDKLVSARYRQPVVSLYLNLSPDRATKARESIPTVFRSLRHALTHGQKSYLDQLDHQASQAVEEDLEQMAQFLVSWQPEGSKSLALFMSDGQLHLALDAAISGQDALVVDDLPYTLPLRTMLASQKRIIGINLESDEAAIWEYRLGTIQQLQKMKSDEPASSTQSRHIKKAQRRTMEVVDHFLKQVAQCLISVANRRHTQAIIMTGDERLVGQLRKFLPSPLNELIVAVLGSAPHQTEADIVEYINATLTQAETQDEQLWLQRIITEGGQGGVVAGLDEVLDAQNRFLLRSMLVDPTVQQGGYTCQSDKYFSTDQGTCPTCQQPLHFTNYLIDRLVEQARQSKMDLKICSAQPQLLSPYNGIVATMYQL